MFNASLDLKVAPHTINGGVRDWCHFLADGICPDWAIFVKTHSEKESCPKKKSFGDRQEDTGKDIECAFGVLIARCHVLARPLRGWHPEPSFQSS